LIDDVAVAFDVFLVDLKAGGTKETPNLLNALCCMALRWAPAGAYPLLDVACGGPSASTHAATASGIAFQTLLLYFRGAGRSALP
jgi:hypothetical protein